MLHDIVGKGRVPVYLPPLAMLRSGEAPVLWNRDVAGEEPVAYFQCVGVQAPHEHFGILGKGVVLAPMMQSVMDGAFDVVHRRYLFHDVTYALHFRYSKISLCCRFFRLLAGRVRRDSYQRSWGCFPLTSSLNTLTGGEPTFAPECRRGVSTVMKSASRILSKGSLRATADVHVRIREPVVDIAIREPVIGPVVTVATDVGDTAVLSRLHTPGRST